jgi:hypothetical protein
MPENVFLFQLLTAAEKNMREALEPLQSFEADAKQKDSPAAVRGRIAADAIRAALFALQTVKAGA